MACVNVKITVLTIRLNQTKKANRELALKVDEIVVYLK
jgi:hypothetical protein